MLNWQVLSFLFYLTLPWLIGKLFARINGAARSKAAQEGAATVLALGGTGTSWGRAALIKLEQALLAHNASPGGSADLLAAALFLDGLGHSPATPSHPPSSSFAWEF